MLRIAFLIFPLISSHWKPQNEDEVRGRVRKSEPTKKATITVAWQRLPTIFTLLIVVWQGWTGILLKKWSHIKLAESRWSAVLFHQQQYLIEIRHFSLWCHCFYFKLKEKWRLWNILKFILEMFDRKRNISLNVHFLYQCHKGFAMAPPLWETRSSL